MKKLLILGQVLLALSSCTPGDGGGSSNALPVHPEFQGDLTQKAHELFNQDNENFLYSCDRQWKSQILEVASALEGNKQNIIEIRKNNVSKNPDAKVTLLNGYSFIDFGPKVDSMDLWETEPYSWKQVYSLFLQIKNNEMDPKWAAVNSDARSLILEDSDRIIYAKHPGTRRSDKSVILSVFEIIKKCYQSESCISLNLENLVNENWLREGVYHSYILSRFNSSDSFEAKRKRIKFLYGDVGHSAERFGFHKNQLVKTEGNGLIVPLNLAILGNDAHVVTELLQKRWSTLGLDLKVVNSMDGYQVEISNQPGERAYVNHSKKLMQLYSPTPLNTVEHEFGHVLGLVDSYYTSFDQNSCEYIDEFNRADIMSNPSSGNVLQAHIQQIKNSYEIK